MSNFKVGEVLILQNCFYPSNNGRECTVVAGMAERRSECSGLTLCYLIEVGDGVEYAALPSQLRRRKPPQSDSNERMHMELWRDMAGKVVQREGEAV
jgi:hypothetical protein